MLIWAMLAMLIFILLCFVSISWRCMQICRCLKELTQKGVFVTDMPGEINDSTVPEIVSAHFKKEVNHVHIPEGAWQELGGQAEPSERFRERWNG